MVGLYLFQCSLKLALTMRLKIKFRHAVACQYCGQCFVSLHSHYPERDCNCGCHSNSQITSGKRLAFPQLEGFWNLWNHQEIVSLKGWQSAHCLGKRFVIIFSRVENIITPSVPICFQLLPDKLIRVDLHYYPPFSDKRDCQALMSWDF